uniref:Putative translation initiation factor eIF-2B subunit gamma n=1 Tax=Lygus hesperus TaxID=30085 RepID=A0A0A9Y249_LYGHE
MCIPKYLLQRFPDILLSVQFEDAFIYICSSDIFTIIQKYPNLCSFQSELIPLLTAMQFVPDSQDWATSMTSSVQYALSSMSCRRSIANMLTGNVRVQAYVGDTSTFMVRCNTIEKYHEVHKLIATNILHAIEAVLRPGKSINVVNPVVSWLTNTLIINTNVGTSVFQSLIKQFLYTKLTNQEHVLKALLCDIQETNQSLRDTNTADTLAYLATPSTRVRATGYNFVDEQTKFNTNCTVQNSVFGKNCRISSGCKIVNCILMDNITVKENVQLSNSIIGSETTIDADCVIRKSIVVRNMWIKANQHYNDEVVELHRSNLLHTGEGRESAAVS